MSNGLRKIVLPVRGDGKGDNVLRHAAVLAHRFGAHIEVTHVRAQAEDLIPFGVAVPDFLKQQIVESAHSQADGLEDRLKGELAVLASELDLTETAAPTGGRATVSFTEEPGRQVDMIRHIGRLADLIAVAQPDQTRKLGTNTLRAAIFYSGRPVMMCPNQPAPASIGRRIAIGWNGSMEASRAMRMSMPLIRLADTVTILTTGDYEHRRASAEELQRHLALHEISSGVTDMADGGPIGERLLETTKALDGDLLIMGAYHEGYARQDLFGGNAQSVIDQADIPVIMAH